MTVDPDAGPGFAVRATTCLWAHIGAGDGIRSDFQPVNGGSGLALGNPTNLNFAQGFPFDPDYNQHPGAFQAYSHYVMPGGLVQSFIDTIGTKNSFRRGGTVRSGRRRGRS